MESTLLCVGVCELENWANILLAQLKVMQVMAYVLLVKQHLGQIEERRKRKMIIRGFIIGINGPGSKGQLVQQNHSNHHAYSSPNKTFLSPVLLNWK